MKAPNKSEQIAFPSRRAFCLMGITSAAGAIVGARNVHAQEFPTSQIRIVVPWNTGGPNDLLARALAHKIAPKFPHPVVVDSKPGANGIIGSNFVARAKPDGHTLLLTSAAHSLNAALYKKIPFDPLTDFAPIIMIATTRGSVLAVRSDFEARTLADYVRLAKESPGKLSYANFGVGNPTHIVGEMFAKAADIKIVPVPYKGAAPLVTDLVGGHIPSAVISTVAANPHIRSGTIRALAIAGEARTPALPDVPTFAEAGYPQVRLDSYYGLWAPAGTPRDILTVLHRVSAAALKEPELEKIFSEGDLVAGGSSPEEFSQYLKDNVAFVRKAIDWIGMPPLDQ
jgi:tripartite-type tricarboxylate transporter receptor subunit TctC